MSRDLKIVSGALLAWGLGEGIFLIFQPLYLQQFGADPILIGTILGINGLVMALVQIPAGYDCNAFDQRYYLTDGAPPLSRRWKHGGREWMTGGRCGARPRTPRGRAVRP